MDPNLYVVVVGHPLGGRDGAEEEVISSRLVRPRVFVHLGSGMTLTLRVDAVSLSTCQGSR